VREHDEENHQGLIRKHSSSSGLCSCHAPATPREERDMAAAL
jgi:hypothetical protein